MLFRNRNISFLASFDFRVGTIPRSTGTGTDPFPSSRFKKFRLPFRSRTCLLFLLRFPFRLRPINSKRTRFPFRPSRTRTSFPVPVPGGMETVYTVTQRLWKTCKIDEYIIRLLDLVAYLTWEYHNFPFTSIFRLKTCTSKPSVPVYAPDI